MRKIGQVGLLVFLSCCVLSQCASSDNFSFSISKKSRLNEAFLNDNRGRFIKIILDIADEYGINSKFSFKIRIKRMKNGLANTTPELDFRGKVVGATVNINDVVFSNKAIRRANYWSAVTGLIAHELGHALEYSFLSASDIFFEGDFIKLSERYLRFYEDPLGEDREFGQAFEHFTDLIAIHFGYAEELADQKRLTSHLLPHTKEFIKFYKKGMYMTPSEIEDIANNPNKFQSYLSYSLKILNIYSFNKIIK